MKNVIDMTPYLSCPRREERRLFSWEDIGPFALSLAEALVTLAIGVAIVVAALVFCIG